MKGFGRLVRRGLVHRRSNQFLEGGARRTSRRPLFACSTATSRRPYSIFQSHDASSGFTTLKSTSISSLQSAKLDHFKGQRRTMFIQTEPTPNPSSLMFYPGRPVMEVGSADFPNARSAMNSPLANSLYGIDGISRVFFGSDFITITKSEDNSWDLLKPEIFAAIMDFYSTGKPLFLDSSTAASMDTAIHEDDSETVAMIKELLETRIRPAVQDDGGDIEYRGFDLDTGVVKLRMQGACSGCPSSSVTLKSGIENMLMHYVPEVKGVEQELDDEDEEATLPA
ncbi:nifU-like protein 4, mitochondrial [Diospyros lotus]|uniref:nifU-like protein 4, mitochondrial n=1 Tax=Diospyros lotus TaxID=55363 RepID=UPI00224F757E|nr:nifU-like protein 4, mitochondrial [Diospyros lotus]